MTQQTMMGPSDHEFATLDALDRLVALTQKLIDVQTPERSAFSIAASNNPLREIKLPNWPVAGSDREIVVATWDGKSVPLLANTPALLVPKVDARLGGLISGPPGGGGSNSAYGQGTGLGAGAAIVTTPALNAGVYNVTATVVATTAGEVELLVGATVVGVAYAPVGSETFTFPNVSVAAGQTMSLNTVGANAGTLTGVLVYSAAIAALLYLCDLATYNAGTVGVPVIPATPAWNFMFGSIIWSGDVVAVAPTPVTLYVATI